MRADLQRLLRSPLESAVLQDGDTQFTGLVSRLRPSQLKPGQVSVAQNIRFDEAGAAKVREGFRSMSGALTTAAVVPYIRKTAGTSALVLIGTTTAHCTGADQGGGRIRITTKNSGGVAIAHGIPATGGMVNLASFTGGTGTLNGNQEATFVSSTTFDVTVAGVSGAWTGGIVGAIKLTGGLKTVHGACRFSDPTASNDESIIIALNEKAVAVKLSTLATTDIAYPVGETVNQTADLQQEFGKVVLRREGKTTLLFDSQDGATGFTGTPAFTKVATGAKTQAVELSDSVSVGTDGKVLFTMASPHGLETGDRVVVVDAGSSGLTVGSSFRITKVTANKFEFFASVKAAGASTVIVRKNVSLGGGFINAPAAAFGKLAGQRVFVPFTHDSAASPSARSPQVRDEIIASDIFDNQTFDPILNSFRLNAGAADHIVGMHPFGDDSLVVFNRNSIHRLIGVSGSLLDVSSHVLTDELGCLARKSIVYHAGAFLFLSDDGVMGLTFQDALNLRGTDVPLSEAIQTEFKRVNRDHMDKAVACYSDNRYYLAVPTGISTEPNEIFVYSFLNNSWESIDTVASDAFTVMDLIPAKSGKVNEVYAVTTQGGVIKISQTGRADDSIFETTAKLNPSTLQIGARLRTRAYTCGTVERKRFNHLELHIHSDADHASEGSFSLIAEDPDSVTELGTLTDRLGSILAKGEGASVRTRTGNPRGFSAQIEWKPSSGRPELRGVSLRGSNTMNSSTSVK